MMATPLSVAWTASHAHHSKPVVTPRHRAHPVLGPRTARASQSPHRRICHAEMASVETATTGGRFGRNPARKFVDDHPPRPDLAHTSWTSFGSARPRIGQAHVLPAAGDQAAQLCIHYDPAVARLGVREIAHPGE